MRGTVMKVYGKSRRLWFLVVFALVAAICTVAEAADANENEAVVKTEVLTPLEERMQTIISIAFVDTDIDAVIRAIARKADLNVVKSPAVTGSVTASLAGVPLQEALSNILAAHGYGYVVDKNIIRVAPIEELGAAEERLVSRIYRITYADVVQVEKALSKFVSGRGSISASPSTSNIIVTDTESKIKAIDTFIAEIDRMVPQILVEARIYDITSRDKLDLGVEWDAGRRTTYPTSPGVGEPTGGRTDPFITSGFVGNPDVTEDAAEGFLRFGWLNNSIDIDMKLRAELAKTNAKLLANPRILVLDNETALFDIVTEYPYTERTISGATITETVKFKNVGVKLQVTPHVTRDGMLRLHLTPEFNVFIERVDLSTNATSVPVVDTRKVNTIALVRDGHTVVIGGLRKKDVSKRNNKIPLLGDIPLLGGLFRFESEDTSNTELVVFITPKIVEQPLVMSASEQKAYQQTEFGGPKPALTRAEKKSEEAEE